MTIACAIVLKDGQDWRLRNSLNCNLRQTRKPDEVLVVDMSSTPENVEAYKKVISKCSDPSIVRFIEVKDDSELFKQAMVSNIAILETKCDYIIFTGIDEVPSDNAYAIAEQVWTENPKSHIMCSRMDLRSDSESPNNDFVNMDNFNKWWATGGERPRHAAPGSFQGLPVQWLKDVGGFDEFFIGWGFFDMDIKERALNDGFREVWINTLGVKFMHVYHPHRPYRGKTDFTRAQNYYRSTRGRIKIDNARFN